MVAVILEDEVRLFACWIKKWLRIDRPSLVTLQGERVVSQKRLRMTSRPAYLADYRTDSNKAKWSQWTLFTVCRGDAHDSCVKVVGGEVHEVPRSTLGSTTNFGSPTSKAIFSRPRWVRTRECIMFGDVPCAKVITEPTLHILAVAIRTVCIVLLRGLVKEYARVGKVH